MKIDDERAQAFIKLVVDMGYDACYPALEFREAMCGVVRDIVTRHPVLAPPELVDYFLNDKRDKDASGVLMFLGQISRMCAEADAGWFAEVETLVAATKKKLDARYRLGLLQ